MKELLEIIDNSDEPVYELNAYIKQLKIVNKQDVAWDILKEIALNGNLKQRFVALTIISINKPFYLEALSIELIKNQNFAEIEQILIPIICICSVVEKEEHIGFMLEVLDYAFRNNKKYLWKITLRNILITNYWIKIKDKIAEIVSNSDNITIIDLFAFFMYEHGKSEYDRFVGCLPQNEQSKIIKLETNIMKRKKDFYQR
ncbi:MAG: hypothetical protein P4L34_08145 [Paludibacter sp.]|nr:hypothetical protein [Paludibacter sp.]